MSFRRGDVLLVRFPNSDLITYKKRPALVVDADHQFLGPTRRLVVCITSNLSRLGRTRIRINVNTATGRQMGLLSDSVIVVDDLAAIKDDEVDQVLGTCAKMPDVEDALRALFGLT